MSSSSENLPLLEVSGLTVNYGSHVGLEDFTLDIHKGEIHVIAGNRGSGKSTLVGVIGGTVIPKAGRISFDGKPISRISPKNSLKHGINTIYSRIPIYLHMSAAENIFLNREIRKCLFIKDKRRMSAIAANVLEQLNCNIDPDIPVRFYDKTIQQKIYLSSILCFESKLIVIDDISEQFRHEELENLHYLLSMLRKNGSTIIYVSSNVDDIHKFANRVTFLHNGHIVNTEEISNIDELKLVELTYSSMFNRSKLERNNIELFYLNNLNRNILKNLPFPIVVTNSQGQIVFSNSSRVKTSGSIDEIFDLTSEQSEMLRLSLQEKKIGQITEVSLRDIFGLQSTVDLHTYPLTDDENSFLGTIYLWFLSGDGDNQYRTNLNTLQTGDDYLKTLSSIEHEIKNPLEIISNYIHLITRSSSTDAIKDKTEIMRNEINRIKRILKKNLTREKIDSTDSIYSIHNLVEEVIEFLKTSTADKKIDFSIDIESNRTIRVDQDLLKQILINIMLNAIEAVETTGEIRVRYLEDVRRGRLHSVITITDNGKGILKEEIQKIFDPFYSTKNIEEAHGLGLSISKDIAERFNGSIFAESSVGKGSTFTIVLPIEENNEK
jgi:signal transduction histidine kinase/ABC-type branched-subunit amino acid transport system ATPase component